MANKIQMVAQLHKAYETYLLLERIQKREAYLCDTSEALFFIFSFSFYQGRRDKQSEIFQKIAEKTCRQYFADNQNFLDRDAHRVTTREGLLLEYGELESILHSSQLNKSGDRLMVISLINFIQSKNEKNIIVHILHAIESGNLAQLYKEIDGIWSVGPKITSLILRDIVCIYELEKYIKGSEAYSYLQPVDTWVHQVAQKLDIVSSAKTKPYSGEPFDITEACIQRGVNPIHFNQGAWLLGARSLNILLANLDKIEINRSAI